MRFWGFDKAFENVVWFSSISWKENTTWQRHFDTENVALALQIPLGILIIPYGKVKYLLSCLYFLHLMKIFFEKYILWKETENWSHSRIIPAEYTIQSMYRKFHLAFVFHWNVKKKFKVFRIHFFTGFFTYRAVNKCCRMVMCR